MRVLLVAAYWIEGDGQELDPLPPPIKGSGAVVTFTPETVDLPGFRPILRRLHLDEAANFDAQV